MSRRQVAITITLINVALSLLTMNLSAAFGWTVASIYAWDALA